jgi:hypothetical protein
VGVFVGTVGVGGGVLVFVHSGQCVNVAFGVSVGLFVSVGVFVKDGVSELVGVRVRVRLDVQVGVSEWVGVSVTVGVFVGVSVGITMVPVGQAHPPLTEATLVKPSGFGIAEVQSMSPVLAV